LAVDIQSDFKKKKKLTERVDSQVHIAKEYFKPNQSAVDFFKKRNYTKEQRKDDGNGSKLSTSSANQKCNFK
jgi:hypothetical protein